MIQDKKGLFCRWGFKKMYKKISSLFLLCIIFYAVKTMENKRACPNGSENNIKCHVSKNKKTYSLIAINEINCTAEVEKDTTKNIFSGTVYLFPTPGSNIALFKQSMSSPEEFFNLMEKKFNEQ